MIRITCPHCKKELKIKSEMAGRSGRCPSCRQIIEIPSSVDRFATRSHGSENIRKRNTANRAIGDGEKEKRTRRRLIYESLIKNVLIIGGLWFILPHIQFALKSIPVNHEGNILSMIGLLLAGSVAGRFAFSYEKTNIFAWIDRFFGHLTTFLLTFGIGLMLEIAVAVLGLRPGLYLFPISMAAITVFAAIILCDFWDVLRLAHYE